LGTAGLHSPDAAAHGERHSGLNWQEQCINHRQSTSMLFKRPIGHMADQSGFQP
jgi:hypothetical protein